MSFFSRKLAKGVRPLGDKRFPNNNNVLVSPADCRISVFKTITEAQKLWVKGKEFKVSKLFGWHSGHAKPFKSGSIAICRLAPQDYHRWHMPVLGLQTHNIPVSGDLLTVHPGAVQSTEINPFTENQRRVVIFKTQAYGKVAMIIVGATLVGSIVVTGKNKRIRYRGEEHGYFQFGGSTLILLFEKGRVQFDDDLLYNSKHAVETLVKARSRIGVATKPTFNDRSFEIALRKEPKLRQREDIRKKYNAQKTRVNMAKHEPWDYEAPEHPPTAYTEDLQPCCVIS